MKSILGAPDRPPDPTYPHRYLWQNEALKSHFNTADIYVQTHSININKQNFPPGKDRWCWVGAGVFMALEAARASQLTPWLFVAEQSIRIPLQHNKQLLKDSIHRRH